MILQICLAERPKRTHGLLDLVGYAIWVRRKGWVLSAPTTCWTVLTGVTMVIFVGSHCVITPMFFCPMFFGLQGTGRCFLAMPLCQSKTSKP